MKFLSLTAAALLVTSAIAQADDSSVAGASTDALGIPSSALILTDDVAAETRGQNWKEYITAKKYWLKNKCRYRINQGTNTDEYCTVLDGGNNYGLVALYESWQDAIEIHEGIQAGAYEYDLDEWARIRSESY